MTPCTGQTYLQWRRYIGRSHRGHGRPPDSLMPVNTSPAHFPVVLAQVGVPRGTNGPAKSQPTVSETPTGHQQNKNAGRTSRRGLRVSHVPEQGP